MPGPTARADDPRPGRARTGLACAPRSASARPPQAMLCAVSPDGRRWTTDALRAVIEQTLDLARIRMVTLERLAGEGAVLPALYVRTARCRAPRAGLHRPRLQQLRRPAVREGQALRPRTASPPVELVTESAFSATFSKIGLREPALTRLEPQSVSGDPEPGALAARRRPAVAGRAAVAARRAARGGRRQPGLGRGRAPGAADHRVGAGRPDGRHRRTGRRPRVAGLAGGRRARRARRARPPQRLRARPAVARRDRGGSWPRCCARPATTTAADAAAHRAPADADRRPERPGRPVRPNAERLFLVLAGAVPDGAAARDALEAGEPRVGVAAPPTPTARRAAARWLAVGAGAAGRRRRVDDQPPGAPLPAALRARRGRDSVVLRADGVRAGLGALAPLRVAPGTAGRAGRGRRPRGGEHRRRDARHAAALSRHAGRPLLAARGRRRSTYRRSRRSRTTWPGCAWPSSRWSAATTGWWSRSTARSGARQPGASRSRSRRRSARP